ncbi:putative membrane protein YagU involved in acid resistance [Methanohalophilus levihalophilus]|nr:putative membrane protein YagU involved in acid resistance [Methanohalophilus levihalophilus]
MILFGGLAIGSFSLELIDTVIVNNEIVSHSTFIYSTEFAIVSVLFCVLSLVFSIIHLGEIFKMKRGIYNES